MLNNSKRINKKMELATNIMKETYGVEIVYELDYDVVIVDCFLGYKKHVVFLDEADFYDEFDELTVVNSIIKEITRVWQLKVNPYTMFKDVIAREFELNEISTYWNEGVNVTLTDNKNITVTLTSSFKKEKPTRTFTGIIEEVITYANYEELAYLMAHDMIDKWYTSKFNI